jgi:predicted metal-dependent peptidase
MARRNGKPAKDDNFELARRALAAHPLFSPLLSAVRIHRLPNDAELRPDTLTVARGDGVLWAHPSRILPVETWTWAIAHALLHFGFDHVHFAAPTGRAQDGPARQRDIAAAAAACTAVEKLLSTLKFGAPPEARPSLWPEQDEEAVAARWRSQGVPIEYSGLSTNGSGPDVLQVGRPTIQGDRWEQLFAEGLSRAVSAAVDTAGGDRASLSGPARHRQPWEQALRWFVSSYPLLGALASGMTLVADAELARSWDISIAAVSEQAAEIYVNPNAGLGQEQWRFVLAHELLHAALRHGSRVGGRDRYLWNVAADLVINGWLIEMRLGIMPEGGLYDPAIRGMSAEGVYDLITRDLRRARKLRTLRGPAGDVLDGPLPRPGEQHTAVDLDEFYRRALSTGLSYHDHRRWGDLPGGLVEEIRALDMPALPWDTRLARWFEEFVPVVEPQRSYARPSRRQASSPDIPRPGRFWPEAVNLRPTFGVIVDSSGSMDRVLLGKALGSIASYATAREVPRARVVFCDVIAYDEGYLGVDEIAGRIRVRGRGGTVLQPGVDLLERADDFPKDGPILIITDGYCDVVRVRRNHAWLVPAGHSLPFTPKGPIFSLM